MKESIETLGANNEPNIRETLNFFEVESTHLKGLCHKGSTLYIMFKNDVLWSYSPFTENAYINFLKAPSQGVHFHKKIKNNDLLTATQIF